MILSWAGAHIPSLRDVAPARGRAVAKPKAAAKISRLGIFFPGRGFYNTSSAPRGQLANAVPHF